MLIRGVTVTKPNSILTQITKTLSTLTAIAAVNPIINKNQLFQLTKGDNLNWGMSPLAYYSLLLSGFLGVLKSWLVQVVV